MKKDLIFEKLSISDTVLEESNRIKRIIISDLNLNKDNFIRQWVIDEDFVYRLEKYIELNNGDYIFDKINKIHYIVVNFENEEAFRKHFAYFNFGGQLNLDSNILTIVFFEINDEINHKFLNSTLYHEIHHMYQDMLYDNGTQISDLYKSAMKIINSDYHKRHSVEYELASLIYFFDKKEIEANMESLYQELINDDGDTKRNNVLLDFERLKDIFSFYKSANFDESLNKICEFYFNIPLKKLTNYVEKRIEYLYI